METINNVAAGVSKAIWGEQNTTQTTQNNETGGKEPISGQLGKGTADSPFDQGNSETSTDTNNKPIGLYNDNNTSTNTNTSTTSTSHHDSTSHNDLTSSNTNTKPTSGSTESSGVSKVPDNPINAASGGEQASKPLENTDKTGVTSKTHDPTKASDIVPSNASSNPGAPSGGETHQKQQGADRPGESPSDKEAGAVKDKKDNAEEILKKRDPNDHSGEPMHMHNGPEKNQETPSTQEERRTSKAGNPGGQEHGKEPKGTGEQYVKTSGLAVDGGDFDATKPGAGKEADRLLEEKGIKKTESGKSGGATTTTSTDSHDKKDKVSTVDKIKGKLHIGHKDK